MSRNRLAIDENIVGVVKWLRFFSYDTYQIPAGTPDREIAAQIREENRILITRDSLLAHSLPLSSVLYVKETKIKDQLTQILRSIGVLDRKDWFSRCSECNVPLTELSSIEIENERRIPLYIKNAADLKKRKAWHCPQCNRIYWEGPHYDRTLLFMEQITRPLEPSQLDKFSRE